MNMTEAAASINMLEDTLKTMKYLYQRIAELEKEKETRPRVYTAEQVSILIGVEKTKIYDLLRRSKEIGGLNGFKIDGKWVVLKTDLDEWFEKQRTKEKSR